MELKEKILPTLDYSGGYVHQRITERGRGSKRKEDSKAFCIVSYNLLFQREEKGIENKHSGVLGWKDIENK